MAERWQVEELLKQHGAKLVRHKKHQVWRFPDGRVYVMSSTPSDYRAEDNNLRDLRRMLGIEREIRKNPLRQEKRGTARQTFIRASSVPTATLRDKLSAAIGRKRDALPSLKKPRLDCVPYGLEPLPRTPLFAILMHLMPLKELPKERRTNFGSGR